MGKIDTLIKQYCPDGVDFLRLSDVAEVCRGIRVVKSQLLDEGFPVYQNCLSPMGYFSKYNCTQNSTFVICGGAAGNVGFSKEKFWAADDCEYIKCSPRLLDRFVYFYLISQTDYLKSQVRTASIPRLSPTVLKNLEIPVPPIEVQQAIVNFLDKITELETELETELKTIKLQKQFYLHNLLSFKKK